MHERNHALGSPPSEMCGPGPARAASGRQLPGMASAMLLLVLTAGCGPGPAPAERVAPSGSQNYVCNDGSTVRVEFRADGLSVDLAKFPDGRVERLTAARLGLPFVGNGINLYRSNGGVVLVSSDAPSRACGPLYSDSVVRAEQATPAARDGRPRDEESFGSSQESK